MGATTVRVRVELGDALDRPADVLVLKYAQEFYGVDRAAASRLGLSSGKMPAKGEYLVVNGPPSVGPDVVVFLGVEPLEDFSYKEIRQFARRVLSTARGVNSRAHEVCLTLHGVGFGLDEMEAFESELAGLLDALIENEFPPHLQVVTFVERDAPRAGRLDHALSMLLPDRQLKVRGQPNERGIDVADRLRTVGYDSVARGHVFVAIPFAPSFDDIFHYGIAQPIRRAGLLCERMDQVAFTGDIVARMKDRIQKARFVVADLTGANPNVYLEVGYAWGRSVPTVLLCDKSTDLKFDVQGYRCLFYESIRDLEMRLTAEIPVLLMPSTH